MCEKFSHFFPLFEMPKNLTFSRNNILFVMVYSFVVVDEALRGS